MPSAALTPLPGIPTSVEKGGDWTLQRLIRETDPVPEGALFCADRAAAPAASAEVLMEVTHRRARHHRPARWRRRKSARGRPTTASGSRRTRPRCSTSTPQRSQIFLAAAFDGEAAAARGQNVGDGTPVHITIPTDNPWVPLRILALGKSDAERVQADVYLLTDRAPALLPAPDGFNGMTLEHRRRPTTCC